MIDERDGGEGAAKAPLISVVVPAYNAEAYIGETLAALEQQTLGDIEIICVDDGSGDGTLRIVREHAAADSRVRPIHQDNAGAGAARNTGLKAAKGDWIAFLDADDFYRSDFLEKMVAAAKDNCADFAICDMDCFVENTGESRPLWRIPTDVKGTWAQTSEYSAILFQLSVNAPFNKVFRRSFIEKWALEFQVLKNSNDLFFTHAAIACSKRFAVVREPLVSYRISGHASIQDDLARHPSMSKSLCPYQALTALREFCITNKFLNEDANRSLDRLCITNAFGAVANVLGRGELFQEVFDLYQSALSEEWQTSKPLKSDGIDTWLKYELLVNATADQFAWVWKGFNETRDHGGLALKVRYGGRSAFTVFANRLHPHSA